VALIEMKKTLKKKKSYLRASKNDDILEKSMDSKSSSNDVCLSHRGLLKHHTSVTSEDLMELSKYFQQRQNLKNLKSEIAESRKKVKGTIPIDMLKSNQRFKQLFMKTLEKLMEYKS
jgi:hypothetical protein